MSRLFIMSYKLFFQRQQIAPFVSPTYMPAWPFVQRKMKIEIIALCFLHLCDTEKPETPPWNFVKKAVRDTWQRSSGGLKWLQYSGIIHDSGILREASGYTAPCVIFTFHHQKSEGELWESQSSRNPGTVARCKYEVISLYVLPSFYSSMKC